MFNQISMLIILTLWISATGNMLIHDDLECFRFPFEFLASMMGAIKMSEYVTLLFSKEI